MRARIKRYSPVIRPSRDVDKAAGGAPLPPPRLSSWAAAWLRSQPAGPQSVRAHGHLPMDTRQAWGSGPRGPRDPQFGTAKCCLVDELHFAQLSGPVSGFDTREHVGYGAACGGRPSREGRRQPAGVLVSGRKTRAGVWMRSQDPVDVTQGGQHLHGTEGHRGVSGQGPGLPRTHSGSETGGDSRPRGYGCVPSSKVKENLPGFSRKGTT